MTLVGAVILASGCATTSPNRFAQFADAGQAYVEGFDALADKAARTAVEADGKTLEQARGALGAAERRERLEEHNELLRERIAVIGDIRRHTALLGEYFATLARLAESDAAVSAGAAAAELGDSLTAVGARVRGASIGEVRVSDLVRPVTELVVGWAKRRALAQELRKRKAVLERELALQEAASRALGEQLKADLVVVAKQRETDEVFRPFVASANLPARWYEARWSVLQTAAGPPELDDVEAALRRLHQSFRDLVCGKLRKEDLGVLREDMQRVKRALEGLSAGGRDGGAE